MSTTHVSSTDSDLDNTLITAVEGGINDWAVVRRYHAVEGTPVTVEVQEDDPATAVRPGWHLVNRDVIARGLQACAERYPNVISHYLQSGGPGDRAPDAEVADAILQAGLFGEIVYG